MDLLREKENHESEALLPREELQPQFKDWPVRQFKKREMEEVDEEWMYKAEHGDEQAECHKEDSGKVQYLWCF